MSKELIGKNGKVVGSDVYLKSINRNTFVGELARVNKFMNYYSTFKSVNSKIDKIMIEIYNDLNDDSINILEINSSERKNLIDVIKGLENFYKITGTSSNLSNVNKIIAILNEKSRSTKITKRDKEIKNGLKFIKSNKYFSKSVSVKIINDYIKNGEKRALKGDERKKIFIGELSKICSKELFSELINNNDTSSSIKNAGKCGYILCSSNYISYIENKVFFNGVKSYFNSSKMYGDLVKKSLDDVINILRKDIENGFKANDFIKDKNSKSLQNFISGVDSVGVDSYNLIRDIRVMSWYVGGNYKEILTLQKNLNKLGIKGENGNLKVDGVYGRETLSAWMEFLNKLGHGAMPTLAWVDPLQNKKMNLELTNGNHGINNVIANVYPNPKKLGKNIKEHLYRIDPPHISPKGKVPVIKYRGNDVLLNYNHLNVDFGKKSTKLQSWIKSRYNHYPLSNKAYNKLKDLKKFGKKVRIGGRILVAYGIVLDTLELGQAIDKDLKDVDKKLGKKTVSAVAKIGGRWGGAVAGAKLGATAGAFTGPYSPIAVPVLSIVGGIGGAIAGDAFGEWVVDITYMGE